MKNSFEFRPQFKLWLAANHRPQIRDSGDAMWRRVRLIPFTVQIPPAERIPRDELLARFKRKRKAGFGNSSR